MRLIDDQQRGILRFEDIMCTKIIYTAEVRDNIGNTQSGIRIRAVPKKTATIYVGVAIVYW